MSSTAATAVSIAARRRRRGCCTGMMGVPNIRSLFAISNNIIRALIGSVWNRFQCNFLHPNSTARRLSNVSSIASRLECRLVRRFTHPNCINLSPPSTGIWCARRQRGWPL